MSVANKIRLGLRPGDFVTKLKQINGNSDLIFGTEFCRPVSLHNHIICLHHLNLSSLYFQSQSQFSINITVSGKLDPITYVGNLINVHFISMNK